MSGKEYSIVGRMEGLWPHQLAKYEMHRLRQGGDLGHVDRTRKNKLLVGKADWAADSLARIDKIRYENYNRELAALEKRKRKKEMMTRIVEGPRDPWRDSAHGPMREMILTANKDFFRNDLKGFFDEGTSLEQQFETVAIDWLKRTFGDDLVHARADLDETAYHIHAVILPITTTKDGRTMVQPSKHKVIAEYEHFQDEIGKAFAPLGLVRGEERAKAVREAYIRGDTAPPPRRHVRTREWRQNEELRLTAERAELDAAKAAQQQAAAMAEAAMQVERDRLARQAAEQDAVLAGADALAAGLIDPAQDAVTLAPVAADDPAAAQIVIRIDKSPQGWRRFAAALTPGWQRMRQAAQREAETMLADEKAHIAHDRAEVESVWQKLAAIARQLRLGDTASKSARDQVAWALARWRVTKDRETRRGDSAQRDD